jgi:hypothetical protein
LAVFCLVNHSPIDEEGVFLLLDNPSEELIAEEISGIEEL